MELAPKQHLLCKGCFTTSGVLTKLGGGNDFYCEKCALTCSSCLNLPERLVVDLQLVGHEYICPRCGDVDMKNSHSVSKGKVEFSAKDNYDMGQVDVFDTHRDPRFIEVRGYIDSIMDNNTGLYTHSESVRKDLMCCVMRIVSKCLYYSPHIRRSVPYNERPDRFTLPKDREVLAYATLMIALDNMRQFSARNFNLLANQPSDKAKKISALKVRIETSSLLNIFAAVHGVAKQPKAVIGISSCMDRVLQRLVNMCNEINLPYKISHRLQERLKEIVMGVLMNGKNTSHLAAAVIVHCCEDCPKFTCYKQALTPSQVEIICESVNLKPRALVSHVKQLSAVCCKTPTSMKVATIQPQKLQPAACVT